MDAESQPTDDEVTAAEQSPSPANPNSVLLTLSWGFFGVGAYLLYWAVSGWYGESSGEEAKLAFATLLGILAFPLGAFVRRWAGGVSRYSGEELVEHIFHEIEPFTDGCLQEDDQTLVVIRSLKDVEPALA